MSHAERNWLLSQAGSGAPAESSVPSWASLLRFPQIWGLVIAKFLSDAAWYFYLFWLPKYLFDARDLDIRQVGYFAWIPHLAAGIGCLVGGILSGWLVHRRFSLNWSRKIALGASAVMMPLVFFIPHVELAWVIVFFSIAYFGQQSWSTLVMTLPADLVPKRALGAVAGMVGFGGAMGGVCFLKGVGYMLDHHSGYGPVFAMAGSFHVIAFGVICLAIPVIRPLNVAGQKRQPAITAI